MQKKPSRNPGGCIISIVSTINYSYEDLDEEAQRY